MSKKYSKTNRKYDQIIKLGQNGTLKEGVLRSLFQKMAMGRKFSLYTPNPEIVNRAYTDHKLGDILLSADYSLPDGTGLIAASRFLDLPKTESKLVNVFYYFFQGAYIGLSVFFNKKWLFAKGKPIKGRELFWDICQMCDKKGWKVFFLGGAKDEARDAALNITRNLKNLKVEFSEGPSLNQSGDPINGEEEIVLNTVIKKINLYNPKIIFVAFGAPKQEYFINKWLKKLNTVGAMGVGGTFSYYSGKMAFPPKWMEKANLEWLWRVLSQPKRIGRIIQATIIFPFRVYLQKLNS
jgi:N-acetylglucosaminyldiphosphoundecaprenol N-acetyl-beta-D-mannosaminyltransferase